MTPLRIAALVLVVLIAPLQILYINLTLPRLPFNAVSIGFAITFIIFIVSVLRLLSIKSSLAIGLIALLVILGICVLYRLRDAVIVAIPLLNILALASHRMPRVEHYSVLIGISFSIGIAVCALGTAPSLAIQLLAGDFQNVHQFIWNLFDGYLVDLSVAVVAILPFIGTAIAMRQRKFRDIQSLPTG
jgi:hypothetical protein